MFLINKKVDTEAAMAAVITAVMVEVITAVMVEVITAVMVEVITAVMVEVITAVMVEVITAVMAAAMAVEHHMGEFFILISFYFIFLKSCISKKFQKNYNIQKNIILSRFQDFNN